VFVRPGRYNSVLAQPLELPDGPLTGEPVEIGRTRISEVLGRYVAATAPTGVVAMLGPIEGVGQFTWMSRDGRVLETVGAPASQWGVELSPDGREVATMRSDGIWTMNLERPVPNRVTSGAHPIWSPDGMRILSLFQGRGGGTFDLVATTVTTGGAESVVETGPAPARTTGVLKPIGWLRQGTIVWVNGSSNSLWTMPIADPRQAAELLDDGAVKPEARLSPDGRWIAYATNRSGRFEVEVRSFPTGPAHPVSTEGGGYPRWRADGRELYFVSATSRLMSVAFAPGIRPAIGKPEALFEVQVPVHPNRFQFAGYGYDASPDGSRFLVNRLVSEPETSMSIIVNWSPPR
jgi:eukaryotic-like serine/threonine-protein kinase